jgi:hypothetical protein
LEFFTLNTRGRSEDWKRNVLRNYQSVKYQFQADRAGRHELTLEVNQTGIVIDQIAVNPPGSEPYYEIPVDGY